MKVMTRVPHKEMRMAITASQMFGRLNMATNDWTDTQAEEGRACMAFLDGSVDAIWIENLNSVFDNDKTLTLANGNQIQWPQTVRLSLSLTTSTMPLQLYNGMVYISSSALDWRPVLQGWLTGASTPISKQNCIAYRILIDTYLTRPSLLNCFETAPGCKASRCHSQLYVCVSQATLPYHLMGGGGGAISLSQLWPCDIAYVFLCVRLILLMS